MRTGRMGQLAYDLCLEMLGSGLVLTPGWHSPSCGTGAPVRPIPLLLYNVRIDLLSRTVSSLRRLKRPFALLPSGTILRLDYLLYSRRLLLDGLGDAIMKEARLPESRCMKEWARRSTLRLSPAV